MRDIPGITGAELSVITMTARRWQNEAVVNHSKTLGAAYSQAAEQLLAAVTIMREGFADEVEATRKPLY